MLIIDYLFLFHMHVKSTYAFILSTDTTTIFPHISFQISHATLRMSLELLWGLRSTILVFFTKDWYLYTWRVRLCLIQCKPSRNLKSVIASALCHEPQKWAETPSRTIPMDLFLFLFYSGAVGLIPTFSKMGRIGRQVTTGSKKIKINTLHIIIKIMWKIIILIVIITKQFESIL